MKGLSPVIASALLIVFTIGVSAALLPLITQETREPLGETEKQSRVSVDCAGAHVDIVQISYTDGQLILRLRNPGQKRLGTFTTYAGTAAGQKQLSTTLSGSPDVGSLFWLTNDSFPYVAAQDITVVSDKCPNAKDSILLPLDNSLIAYWDFENDLLDKSGNKNNGTLWASGVKNRILNPSFEAGARGYATLFAGESGTPEVVYDATAPHGKYVAHFVRNSQGSSEFQQYVPIVGGRTYTFSAWGKTKDVVQGPNSWNKMYIFGRWVYPNGTEACCPDLGFNLGTNDWTRKNVTQAAPVGTTLLRFYFGLSSATGEGWIDGFQLDESNALTGFEESVWQSGKKETGVRFDGVDDYATIPNSSSLNPLSISIAFWYYNAASLDCDANNNWRSLLSKGATSGTSTGYDLVLEQSNTLTWDIGNGTAQRLYPSAAIPVGNWSHIATTYNHTTGVMALYVNGVPGVTKTIVPSPIVANAYPLNLSRNAGAECPNQNGAFNGTIDELRIYTRALSPQEVRGLYIGYA